MVSVIIPNYNHFDYLEQRIDSVLFQTYKDFEVIILDDCSTDNSREIIEKYRNHPKVSSIVYNEVNSGSVFSQWSKGIDLAEGKYIWIAESDDFAEPDFLLKMIPVLEQDPTIGLIYCNSKVIYSKAMTTKPYATLNDLRKYMTNGSRWNSSFTMDGQFFLKEYLSKKCVINNASATIMKKEAINFKEVNLERFRYAGDWAVYNNIALTHKISFLNEVLSNYRDHASNTSKKAFNNFKINYENYMILSDYYNFLRAKNIPIHNYLFSIRKSFLPLLITSRDRKHIYASYKKINSAMLRKSLVFLPMVFGESLMTQFFNKYIRNK